MSLNRKSLRKKLRLIHLYLGLGTGLVVFIVALTGCLWVFQEEFKNFSDPFAEKEASAAYHISPTEARVIAESVFPGKTVHGTLYQSERKKVEVIFYEAQPEFYRSVYLDPQDGEILGTENHLKGFFPFVLEGHMHIWLPEKIGSQIVAWSTVIFTFMLISGIILWWPRNKTVRKQRLWFRWKKSSRWKRKNYDLHQIIGFYISFLAMALAFTGLVMTFDSFEKWFYRGIGGDKELHFIIPELSNPANKALAQNGMDQLLPLLEKRFPNAESLEFHYPHSEQSSIYVEISWQEGVYYNSDYLFFDPKTLEEVATESIYGPYAEAQFSDLALRMNYDIHVGAIGGLAGKILAFFISLSIASLPVTGFLIWWGRRSKKANSQT
ncbi:PepSY-associated TM helix domain-containing protein [Croceimicrobium hydrocarbonivorans]|uniref:PepSY domain-containing protein n=1 Tax=Croceimicrobium hydrocarbonivorans TaxID=2761580 RepID=A0A7H0VHT9_9FLAO|nr:PepSY-associated TM helix domain-containing protein [Croceimicrobium hydrocarbonivorans]QNR25287.1 PepSY domain-containing protein [Croceimicrobium hydrocarbonivorans]